MINYLVTLMGRDNSVTFRRVSADKFYVEDGLVRFTCVSKETIHVAAFPIENIISIMMDKKTPENETTRPQNAEGLSQ